MDQQARETYRGLIRGGMFYLADDEVENLQAAIDNTKRGRGLATASDRIIYLQEYVKIQEEFLNHLLTPKNAHEKIQELNEKYAVLGESVLKTGRWLDSYKSSGMDLDYNDEDWESSGVCW
jgi:hypothetical protein